MLKKLKKSFVFTKKNRPGPGDRGDQSSLTKSCDYSRVKINTKHSTFYKNGARL